MSKLHEAAGLGQSIWLNSFDRSLIHNHRLLDLIHLGVHGITSNPGAFAKALANSKDYDEQLRGLVREGKSIKQIAEEVLFTDIQTAVDLIHPIYERTNGVDGYVCLDVNPALENDIDGMVSEGLRLAYDVDRVNVMIQIPATSTGIQAIEKLIGEGANINATHIYTVDTYEKVAQAYISGMDYFWTHLDIWRLPPAAVASLPVTRLDEAIDSTLTENSSLQGKVAIALAKVVYGQFREIFSSDEWRHLSEHGSRLQRPLWASSNDPRYVINLMGPSTVHSLPPAHITDFLEDSPMTDTITAGRDAAEQTLAEMAIQGIDLQKIERQLQADAIKDIRQSYQNLENNVIRRRDELADTY